MNLRILVLTSSTGAGHDQRARAFAEWVSLLHGADVDVRIEQMLEASSPVLRGGVSFYNMIQRRAPWVHHPFYLLVEGLGILNRNSVTFGNRYYLDTIRDYRPHLVFSVHDCLNRGYFPVARAELGSAVRCATYCGEFAGGYGFSRNWVEHGVDLFQVRTATAGDYAVKLGLARHRIRVRGHLMRPRSVAEHLDAEGRAAYLRALGLEPGRFTLLLATGGAGANNHLAVAEPLAAIDPAVQLVFVCGRNTAARVELETWKAADPGVRAVVLGFTEEMHLLMQAADAVFTRGGTTTCAKALHFRRPVIFNSLGGVMPQERLTQKYFLRGGGAEAASNPAQVAAIVANWSGPGGRLAERRARIEELRYAADSTDVIADLVTLAARAAGRPVPPRRDWRSGLDVSPAYRVAMSGRPAPAAT